ncbi:glutathionylspermidine synthase family protein [Nocardioides sp. zg-579]|uniref:Glutathionylspermidine synthase family protein n=1 Tax=Nocardioides marmotae TaxID=2663857 RepID=A0A6I3JE30_9ACTN|nr:glutathionylspermidine synthase family protein [Nocardioides marmotae]MCR6032712.1 glutathionylspermidine synthase family protein [Gordonia jinghuaiqii]MTB96362.1 glutathionylspermidine synthase family protein [Nocardioides marmotae]QKE03157.1 glutathionylspermidine synthase family protein [Nocardioides marmotae]
MWRHRARPRPDWERIVTEQGLIFPTTAKPDGTTVPYWNEAAWYELTMDEVEMLEAATEELWAMCVDAAGHMAATMTDERLGLPPGTLGLVRESIARQDPAIYARFDLAYGADGSVKMLEVNGDTATGLVETGVAQWRWVEDVMSDIDQWNSVHDRLVNAWRRLLNFGALGDGRVHFLYDLGEEGSYDGGEMEMTVHYLMDCAIQAGVAAIAHPIAEVGWNPDAREFRDVHDQPIRTAFKLYPWEQMLGEDFGRLIVDHAEREPVRWFEPPWKVLLSTKAILPVLWERNPGHRLLLPAHFDEPRDLTSWVAKPLHGREGDNIHIRLADGHETRMPGVYGEEGFVYQAYTELPVYEGNHVVLGSWIVDGQAAGMIVRESDGPVTDYFSRVVPHAISDALSPDDAQVQAWILERVPADPPRLSPGA